MTIGVDRSRHDINVSCEDGAGRKGVATSKSSLEPWFLGNIFIGGPVGMSVDALDGAANKYETPVWVSLGDATPQPPIALDGTRPASAPVATMNIVAGKPRLANVVSASTDSATIASAPVATRSSRSPFLVKAAEVDEPTSVALRMNAPRGVVLLDVLAGGAAASSGLLPGTSSSTLRAPRSRESPTSRMTSTLFQEAARRGSIYGETTWNVR